MTDYIGDQGFWPEGTRWRWISFGPEMGKEGYSHFRETVLTFLVVYEFQGLGQRQQASLSSCER